MKYLHITTILLIFTLSTNAQKIYSVGSQYEAGDNDGKWFFTGSQYEAKKKIFFTGSQYEADLKIYFVGSQYEAGWTDSSKKHLLY